MDKPPEGGATPRTLASSCVILALCVIGAGAQMSQEYGCPPQEKISPCRCSTRGMEFQIWCSHSELPSVLEGLRAVSRHVTHPVDELILENNNLPSLPGNVFTSLRVLRLMLRNNRLERVASSWLDGLHDSLLELFLVEPDLRSLPIDSLENLRALEAITLQSRTMKRLPRFTSLTKLRYLQVNSPALTELSPLHFRDLPSLEQLHVFGSPRLRRLEAGLLRDMHRLSLLNISGNAITWIHPRAFIGLPELREMALRDNEIADASIVGRAIVDLPSLHNLDLEGNRIDRLGDSSFVDNTALRRVSLARNRVTELGSGAFQRLPNLRVLDLSHNRLRRVSPEFFLRRTGDGSGLEEIRLVDNRIGHCNELRAILEALPGLKLLDASHNYVEEIPYGALHGHPTLERLHLDHNRLNFLQRDTFVAMPALRELRLRNNSLNEVLDMPFWNLPGLKGLDLSENYFRHVGPRLLMNLPNLRRLDLSGNGIATIEATSFAANPALEHLNFSGNALAIINPMTFRHLSSLYELDLGWNRLLEIVPGLPRNIEHLHLPMNRIVALPSNLESRDLALPSLRSLDLGANGIARITPGSLADLANLRKLNLGYNAMASLEDGTLDGLARLEKLDLRYNRLITLHGRSLKPLRNLMDLDVRGNRLEVIRPDLFQESLLLQRLDISRNNLAQIPHATFSNTRGLRELYASHNSLTELPMSLHGLTALEVLDLSFNKLNILSPETLSSLSSLLELRLVRNRIRELREGAFDRLPRLTFIDLENNDLRVIEKNAIRSLPELQSLRLGKNRLRTIPNGAFSELPLLQSAELQENRIQEIFPNAFVNVPHLLFLNLSHNQLPEMNYVGLESLGSLEVLDLSNNRISRISGDSLATMEWLVELKMDNNRICSIQGSPFDDMPRLRVLSLRSNRMTSVTEKAFKRLRSNIAILDIDGNPLSCSCGMLWLRGWLQQAPTDGPRCADGSLFKKIRLSRQDCERATHVEPVYPGCEAEIHQSSLSFASMTPEESLGPNPVPGWMSHDSGHKAETSQNLDYFVSYEDYQEDPVMNNASMAVTLGEPSTTVAPSSAAHVTAPSRTSITQEMSSTQEMSANSVAPITTTQRTPTRNKNSSVPPSPSSSGFTFFGVPLPNINFNLWGNTGSRSKAQRREDNVGKTSLHLRPGRGRYRVFPPTEPEIHRGGFVPMPQGQAGFVPIPDPRLSYERKQRPSLGTNETRSTAGAVPERTATITRVYQIPGRRKTPKVPPKHEDNPRRTGPNGKTMSKEREELTTPRIDAAALSSATNTRSVPSNFTGSNPNKDHEVEENVSATERNTVATTEQSSVTKLPQLLQTARSAVSTAPPFLPTELSALPTELPVRPPEVSSLPIELGSLPTEHEFPAIETSDSVIESALWTIPSTLESDEKENLTAIDLVVHENTTRVQKIGIWDAESRLPPGKHISAEDIDSEDPVDYRSSMKEEPSADTASTTSQDGEILEASALSALLIPGGQVSSSVTTGRPPSGRSTIVKVASPHLSLTAERNMVENEETSSTLNANTTSQREKASSLDESVKLIEDNSFNWYFQNYNESNIEPYVAVGYSGVETIFISKLIFIIHLYTAARMAQ